MLGSLKTAIPDVLAKETSAFIAHYGVRFDDQALVFHFFPPRNAEWPADMSERLEKAIAEHFDVSRVTADYTTELNSFCVIYGGGGLLLSPLTSANLFLESVLGPQDES